MSIWHCLLYLLLVTIGSLVGGLTADYIRYRRNKRKRLPDVGDKIGLATVVEKTERLNGETTLTLRPSGYQEPAKKNTIITAKTL